MTLSLRARLAAAIVGVAGAAAAVLAALLYAAVAAVLWADLDRELGETAAIFAELAEWDPEDGYELEGGEAIARQLAAGARPRLVTVRAPGGAALLEPPRAHPDPGDMPEGSVFALVAEGRAWRGVRRLAAPRSEGPPAPGPVEVVVVADTAGTRATLAEIAAWCWLLAAGTIALAALASRIAADRGLAPVRRLARALDRICGHDDALALTAEEVPAELRVIVREIGALLGRLREAFARERRFVADASHELRTPVSVLRTALDVALAGEHPPADQRRRLLELQEIAGRLSATLDRLLLLTRAQAGQVALRRAPLPIYALVEEGWAPLAAAARRRGLTFVNACAPEAVLEADEPTLRMILANLLSNACEYTASGGEIWVGPGEDPRVLLLVRDSGPPIAAEHLPHLFEPFWRADPRAPRPARTAGSGSRSRGRWPAARASSSRSATTRPAGSSPRCAGPRTGGPRRQAHERPRRCPCFQ